VSLATFTKHLESLERDEESMIKKNKQQEQQIKHESQSLKSLITNDHLSQMWNLKRLKALNVSWNGLLTLVLNVYEWSAWIK
jgi:DNA topoisomerase IB